MKNFKKENSGISVAILLRELGKLIRKAKPAKSGPYPVCAASEFLADNSLLNNPGLRTISEYSSLFDVANPLVKLAEQIASGTSDACYTPFDRLQSIFANMGENKSKLYHEIDAENWKSTIFAREDGFYSTSSQYGYLWSEIKFQIAAAGKVAISATHFLHNLLDILKRYTACIPCDVKNLPDVSLYDYAKTLASICVAIHRNKNQRLKFIGGDLSGIQNYIYDIASAKASKNLKGRSFYLQMLVDEMVQKLLTVCHLNAVSVLYASGGSFFIIAPNNSELNDSIIHFRDQLEEQLFEQHGTRLYLALSSVDFTASEILDHGFSPIWTALFEQIGVRKRRRYVSVIERHYNKVFEPQGIGGKQLHDYITGEEFSEREQEETLQNNGQPDYRGKYIQTDKQGNALSKRVAQQIDLGRKLRSSRYWISGSVRLHEGRTRGLKSDWSHYLLESLPERDLSRKMTTDNFTVRSLTDAPPDYRFPINRFFYGGNDYPKTADGSVQEFQELAKSPGGAFERLGILRMDVDSLGALFKSGLGSPSTISRYASLSRQLDTFFKGYLNVIWEQPEFRDTTFIVYSGGDDLFIVGQWERVIGIAKTIRARFSEFVSGSDLTLSGGIAIVNPKFPIGKAAELSAQAEKQAKQHHRKGVHKNALTLLNTPLTWDYELPIVEEIKDQLVQLIRDQSLPRGVLNKLMNYAEVAEQQRRSGENERWRWHMAYDFSRAAARAKRHSGAETFYDRIKVATFSNTWNGSPLSSNYTFLQLLAVAARWTEMVTKNIAHATIQSA